MAEYGFDLVREIDTVTCRRLWVMIQGLPADAAVWRKENAWSPRDEIQALGVERLEYWGRRLYEAAGGKVRGEELHIPRPGEVTVPRKTGINPRQIAQFVQRMGG